MKFKIKSLVIALAATSCVGVTYANTNSQTALVNELKAVNQEMQQLQHQVSSLQGQVNSLKTKLRQQKQVKKQVVVVKEASPAEAVAHNGKAAPKKMAVRERLRAFGTSVVTGPFTSGPTYFNGSQLVVNSPSINEDVSLLRRRADSVIARQKVGLPPALNPRLVLSGALEGLGQYSSTYTGSSTSDLNLSTAKMDFFAEITHWVNGFMSFAYDDSPPNTSANRIDNSRIFLDNGFITIGNLAKTPFYGSIGQMYIPFGRYSSSMISSPLTEFVGKTKARAIVLGYHHMNPDDKPYAEVYFFRSASNNTGVNRVNGYGADAGYAFKLMRTTGKIGVSYINNIADALGFQDNGLSSPNFQGFNQNSNTEDLSHLVPGGDIHAVFGFGPLIFLTEYVSALSSFSSQNLTYNGHGAEPSAFNAEATYTFDVFHRPSTFTLNYGFSRQALALNIPRQRYGAAFQVAVVRDTLLTLEYLHNINYSKSDTATGQMLNATTVNELGKTSNTVTAQIGVYF